MKSFKENYIYEAMSEETRRLRVAKNKIHEKIYRLKRNGGDPATIAKLEQELAAAWEAYNAAKIADKNGTSKPATPTTPKPTVGRSRKSAPSKPTPHNKEWDEGYKAAVEAIKQVKSGQAGQSGQSGMSGQQSDNELAPIPQDPSDQEQQSSGSGSGSRSGSRNGDQSGQGVVRPEDCIPPGNTSLDKTPGNAGGMISKDDGDKIAESEGYDKQGGNEESTAKEWAERARKAASQMQGKGEGYERLKGNLDNLYKATKDWKKELKKIVGHSISPEEKRSAYANKNILISQDRIARTDKDKYDNLDYMMVAIDTSGSMTQEYLMQCLCEVYQVALAKKPVKLVIIQFDTRIADIQEFTNVSDLKKKMNSYTIKGGGGTDCKPVFDLLLKDKKYNRRPAELLMIFTDGYLEQYRRNPRTMKNLCWVVVDNLGFDVKFKDAQTKCVRLRSEDMGK